MSQTKKPEIRVGVLAALTVFLGIGAGADVVAGGLSFEQLAAVRSVDQVAIAAGGSFIAYSLDVPRKPGVGEDGSA